MSSKTLVSGCSLRPLRLRIALANRQQRPMHFRNRFIERRSPGRETDSVHPAEPPRLKVRGTLNVIRGHAPSAAALHQLTRVVGTETTYHDHHFHLIQ